MADLVREALAPGKRLEVGESTFETREVLQRDISPKPGEYVTLSPILLRDKSTGRSIVFEGPRYLEILALASNKQVINHLGREGTVSVRHFEPQGVRKRTIKGRVVLAQKGRLLLEGGEEDLRLLVDHGIGASPALGFGMVVPTEEANDG